MQRFFAALLLILMAAGSVRGQVGIGTNTPDASSVLELQSSSAGLLPPRLTTTQRNAITTPATGLTLYNTSTNTIDVYDGSQWQQWFNGSALWDTTGSDAHYTAGNVGIGIAAPQFDLHVRGSTPTSEFRVEPSEWNSTGDYARLTFGDGNHYIQGSFGEGIELFDTDAIALTGSNVGIGTTGPTRKLDIQTGQDGNVMGIVNTGLGDGRPLGMLIGSDASTNNAAEIRFNRVTAGNASNFLNLGLFGNANAMTVHGSGNVGIGTTSPAQALDVQGNLRVSALAATGSDSIVVSNTNGDLSLANAENLSLWETDGNSVWRNSNVGIGGQPQETFEIFGSDNVDQSQTTSTSSFAAGPAQSFTAGVTGTLSGISITFNIIDPGDAVKVELYDGSDPNSPGALLASATRNFPNAIGSGSEQFFPLSASLVSGNGYHFRVIDVNGQVNPLGVGSDNYPGGDLWIDFGSFFNNFGDDMAFKTIMQAEPIARFEQNGNVGIGTSSPASKLQVAGDLTLGSGGTEFTLPSADGATDEVLVTDGSGTVSWGASPGDNLGNHQVTQPVTTTLTQNSIYQVGDDAWIDDINSSNAIGIVGQNDATIGGIRLGDQTNNPFLWGDGNRFAVSAGGATRLFLDNGSGNIGMGTSNPDASLTLTRGRPDLALTSTNTNDGMRLEYNESSQQIRIQDADANGAFASQTVMAINRGGKVGIGTTGPAVPLHIKQQDAELRVEEDAGRFIALQPESREISIGGFGELSLSGGDFRIPGGNLRMSDNSIYLRTGTDTNHGLRHTLTFGGKSTDGPVLFGYNGGLLGTDQSGTENVALAWNDNGRVAINDPISTDGFLHVRGDLSFHRGGNYTIGFPNDGNYGGGSVTIQARNSVNDPNAEFGSDINLYAGDRNSDGTNGAGGGNIRIRAGGNTFGTNGEGKIFFQGYNGTSLQEWARFSEGDLGIGTTPFGFDLQVNGSAAKSTGSSWTIASDRRLKRDIEGYGRGLALIDGIRPVRYHYNGKAGIKNTERQYVGVIAQELQEVAPSMIRPFQKVDPETGDTTEYLGVNPSELTYAQVNAIQELHERVKRLEKQNRKLSARAADLQQLKAENARLAKRTAKLEQRLEQLEAATRSVRTPGPAAQR